MHHIYTTPAFIVHSSSYGESGKFLLLFTKDFGMIGAIAQGIRQTNSKLKYHLQDFAFSDVSLVRGREVWKIVGASEIDHAKSSLLHLKILKFLKRLLHGEERNEKLFQIIEEIYIKDIKGDQFEKLEYLTILRIMHNLGYIRRTDKISLFLQDYHFDKSLLEEVGIQKRSLIVLINNALKESHL